MIKTTLTKFNFGIPSDWDSINLHKIGTFKKGKNIPKSSLVREGYSCVLYGEIYTTYNFVATNLDSFIPYEHTRFSTKITKGDLLFTGSGETSEEIGKCIAYMGEQEAFAGGDIIILTPLNADSVFLGYLLNSAIVNKQKQELGQGHSVVHIYSHHLKTITIPFPPLHEQRAIAEVLSDVDALITAQEALIVKKRAIKEGVMQELLTGKRRPPGFSGEWKIKKLGEVADIKTGKKNNDDKIEDGAYPFFVRSQNIERINTYSFEGEAILVPGEGNIGSIYHYINGKFDYHQRVYKISDFKPNVCGKFIYYLMTQTFNEYAMRNTVKATVDSLRLPTFQKFEILISDNEKEQEKIAAIISEFDQEIFLLEEKSKKTKALKQGMMQELLTGRIRLIGE